MIQILKAGKIPDPLPYHTPLLNLYSLYDTKLLDLQIAFLTLYLSLKQVPILCSKTPPPWGGGLKISKPRGPMGWGIQNFKTPGSPWGGGFEIPWGIPNTNMLSAPKCWQHWH